MKQYYHLMNFERDVSGDYFKILDVIKKSMTDIKGSNTINTRDGNSKPVTITKEESLMKLNGMTKLFSTLDTFNKNLITLNKEDLIELGIIIDNEATSQKEESLSNNSNDIIDLLCQNDCFNILGISDIDYLITQELQQAEQNSMLIIPNNIQKTVSLYTLNNQSKKDIKENLLSLPVINYHISQSLEEKAMIAFGEEQGKESLKGIESSFELTKMKYQTDHNKLISSLRKEIVDITKKDVSTKIKLRTSTMLFFIKNVDNKLSFNQRLTIDNVNKKDMLLYQSFGKFIEYLYSFRSKQKTMLASYYNEINDLKATSSKLLQEDINEAIMQRKNQIAQYDFDLRKQEMKVVHMKNKEIFNIKQKMNNEKKKFEDEMTRVANEKIEKDKKERDEKNKALADHYNKQKKQKEEEERIKMQLDQELLIQKERIEIQQKLPQIQQRQIQSTEQFIQQQKYKENEKLKKEYDKARINDIVENYKSRPQVEADPERLISITKNLQSRYESIHNNKMDEGEHAQMFNNNGFTVEHLMKDFRYKVSSVLFEAGIVNKDYGHQVMQQLNNMHCANNINNANTSTTGAFR